MFYNDEGNPQNNVQGKKDAKEPILPALILGGSVAAGTVFLTAAAISAAFPGLQRLADLKPSAPAKAYKAPHPLSQSVAKQFRRHAPAPFAGPSGMR